MTSIKSVVWQDIAYNYINYLNYKMKILFIALFSIFLVSGVYAEGIKFEHCTYEEALAKAKKENKKVFIDCYTVWCGPCKKLAKEIFTQDKVGEYFNKNFVCIKMDMEKGEGIELREFYEVKVFPTLLFLNTEGEVDNKCTGYRKAEELVAEAQKALKK